MTPFMLEEQWKVSHLKLSNNSQKEEECSFLMERKVCNFIIIIFMKFRLVFYIKGELAIHVVDKDLNGATS